MDINTQSPEHNRADTKSNFVRWLERPCHKQRNKGRRSDKGMGQCGVLGELPRGRVCVEILPQGDDLEGYGHEVRAGDYREGNP